LPFLLRLRSQALLGQRAGPHPPAANGGQDEAHRCVRVLARVLVLVRRAQMSVHYGRLEERS